MPRRSKGEGSIYFDKTAGMFTGTIELPGRNGIRRRRKVRGDTRQAVADKLRELREARDTAGAQIVLDDYLDEWLLSRDVVKLRASTRQSYADTLRLHVRPGLATLTLAQLTPAMLDDWLEDLHATKRTVATIRYAKIVLRIALQRAVRRGLLEINPATVLRVTGGTKRAPTAMTGEQVAALLEAATPWLKVAILVAVLGGLRRGEVCGLRWDDLDWATGTITIARAISAVPKNGQMVKTYASLRAVSVPGFVVRALEGHRRRMELTSMTRRRVVPPWIFPADTGKPKHPRNFLHAYEAARTAANLPGVRFHDLRHTCATALLTLGTDVKAVSQMLGHRDVRTTLAMYHHPHQGAQRKGADALQRWLIAAGAKDEEPIGSL